MRIAADTPAARRLVTAAAPLVAMGLGAGDVLIALPEVRFGTLYVVPVLVAQAWGAAGAGVITAVVSAIADGVASWCVGVRQPVVLVVMGVLRLGVYLLCAGLVRTLQRDRGRLHRLATVDTVTGLYNRRGFAELAEKELERSRRHGHPVSLLYLDVNDFKGINDRYGHSTGDGMLAVIAGFLTGTVRGHDLVARIGGDEFAILLPETDVAGASAVAAHLAACVRTLTPPPPVPPGRWLGLSIGVTTAQHRIPDLAGLLHLADLDMYRHKNELAGLAALAPGSVGVPAPTVSGEEDADPKSTGLGGPLSGDNITGR